MRVALVHDWLVTYAGAERVLSELINVFPDADLFSVIDFLSDTDRERIGGKRAVTTFIQSLPAARTKYRSYLPLMPLAVEQLDLSAYDLVISSSHAVAKGVLTGPDQLHICYIHSPIRYAWDMQHQYLRESGLQTGVRSWLARALLHRIRLWDSRTANGVDRFLCNSSFIARRVRKTYGRSSQIVYPPVDTDRFCLETEKDDFYLTASRLVPYKRVDLIVEAFAGIPGARLIVVGDGPEAPKIKAASGVNVEMMGYQPDDVLRKLMSRARAFVFAAEEDFGIIPVEAQACGTPVIAFGKGGALETVVANGDAPTGLFFQEQTAKAIRDAVVEFELRKEDFRPEQIRANAERFATSRFHREILAAVEECLAQGREGYWR